MYFYIRALILIHTVLLINCNEELEHQLTKNKTKEWLKNVSRKTSVENPYCSICCIDTTGSNLSKICGKHTMCLFPDNVYGPGCKGVFDIPIRQQEIDSIVDAHNTIRNTVALGAEERGNPGPQPHASNMREIEWNEDLAKIAHRWVAQCVYMHDECRDLGRYLVGQNIAKGMFATNTDLSFIVTWYNNVDWMNPLDLDHYHISVHSPVHQYTQLVWADTYEVGCARLSFKNNTEAETSYNEHFICNYGPTGNIPGQPVYKKGPPCSACPDGTGSSIDYPGLCKNELVYDTFEFKRVFDDRSRKHPREHGPELNLENSCPTHVLSNKFLYYYYIIYFYRFI